VRVAIKWVTGFLLAATGVTAVAQNYVANPNFDSDLSVWSSLQNATWDSADGSPAAGSMDLASTANSVAQGAQCVPIPQPPPANVDFYARMYVKTPGNFAAIFAVASDLANCSTSNGTVINLNPAVSTPVSGNPASGWVEISATNQPLPNTTQAVVINLQVSAGPQEVVFDHVFFGATGTLPVRLQSFGVE